MSEQATFDDFMKIDIRTGTIVKAEEFPEARKPAFKLWIDFGNEIGVKKSSAQITERYKLDELVGKRVMGVVNFAPRQVGPFMSETLTLGFADSQGRISVVCPDNDILNGERLF